MTEYSELVEQTKLMIAAEEWGMQVKTLHCHSMNSMAYDTRPQDTAGGKSVMDIEYNGGWIDRHQNGQVIHTFGERLDRAELLDKYGKVMTDAKRM